jgi:hypothetical protein
MHAQLQAVLGTVRDVEIRDQHEKTVKLGPPLNPKS